MSWMMFVETARAAQSIDLDGDQGWDWLESELLCLTPGETMTITYEGDGE